MADQRTHRPIYALIALSLLMTSILIGYGYVLGDRMNAVESPLLGMVREIALEASTTRLWIEEALDGENVIDDDLTWNFLEQAVMHLKALAQPHRLSTLSIDESGMPGFVPMVFELEKCLEEWRAEFIRASRETAPFARPVSQRPGLAGRFENFSKTLHDIESVIQRSISRKKNLFRAAQASLFGLAVLLAAGVGFAVRRYERERNEHLQSLNKSNSVMRREIVQRKAAEKKLKAAHQFIASANRHKEVQPLLDNLLAVVMDISGCDAAAVRIEDDSLQNVYISASGFEVSPCQCNKPSHGKGQSRACLRLLDKSLSIDPSHFTDYGTFFTNAASGFRENLSEDLACPAQRICGGRRYESFALVPIRDGFERLIGVIHIAFTEKNRILAQIVEVLEAGAMQLETAIKRVRVEEALKDSHDKLEARVRERTKQLEEVNRHLEKEVQARCRTERSLIAHQLRLRKMSSALLQTEERERRRIAGAIHDGIGQTMAAAKIKLDAIRASLGQGNLLRQLTDIRDLMSRIIHETRSLTFELSPPVLYEIGLQAALEWMADRYHQMHGLTILIEGDGSDQWLDVPHRVFLFQSLRELSFNVVKHAQATQAVISIQGDAEFIRFEVSDDGRGFDAERMQCKEAGGLGFGLFRIREQLRHYGGVLTLNCEPGVGTRVVMRVPLKSAAPPKERHGLHDSCAAGG